MLGNWNVNVITGAMPQKVASAVGKLAETLIGAEYTPIAYLGSQPVNGTNHAVLAEQVVTTGRDTKNIVVLIFNEKPGAMEATLVNIERVVEGGMPLGGINIDVHTDIPEEAMAEWNSAFEGFVGSSVTPKVLLGTQVVKGIDYNFLAEVKPVVANPVNRVAIVTVNGLTKNVTFSDLLENRHEASLQYAFTWLKNGLSAPLGEWP